LSAPTVAADTHGGESFVKLWTLAKALHEKLGIAPDPALIAFSALDTAVRTGSVELLARTSANSPAEIRRELRRLVARRATPASASNDVDKLVEGTAAGAKSLAASQNMSPTLGHVVFSLCRSDDEVARIFGADCEYPQLELEDRLLASVVDPRTTTIAAQRVLWRAVDAARFSAAGVVTFRHLLRSLIEDEGRLTAAQVMIRDFVEHVDVLDEDLRTDKSTEPHESLAWEPALAARLERLTRPEHREFTDTADVLLAIFDGPLPKDLEKTLAGVGMTAWLFRSASRGLVRSTLDRSDRTVVQYCDRFHSASPDALVDAPPESASRQRKTSFAARSTAATMYHIDFTALSIRRANLQLPLNTLLFIANLMIVVAVVQGLIAHHWLAAGALILAIRFFNGNTVWFVWFPIQVAAAAVAGPLGAVAVVCRVIIAHVVLQLSLQQRRVDAADPSFTLAQLRRDTRVGQRMTLSRALSLAGRKE
jgi:membrane protein implicated in regulation of membrane protease activity